MADRLFVAVIGNRNSGKSFTWNKFFGQTVRTRKTPRKLQLRKNEYVEVFLISGSNEERNQYAGDILRNVKSKIVLCSVQYVEEGRETFEFAFENGFDVYVQWLNPGYQDAEQYFDYLGWANYLLDAEATITMRESKQFRPRIQELKQQIYGWAAFRNLIVNCGKIK